MASLDEFSRYINAIAVQVAEGGDSAVRKAFLAMDQAVVMATPVDKSTARSNWLPNIDVALDDVIEAHAVGSKGSTGEVSGAAAMQAAANVAASYDGSVHRSLHLTNNLPYISELNGGSSRQAPALFVEAGVAAGVAVVPGARILP